VVILFLCKLVPLISLPFFLSSLFFALPNESALSSECSWIYPSTLAPQTVATVILFAALQPNPGAKEVDLAIPSRTEALDVLQVAPADRATGFPAISPGAIHNLLVHGVPGTAVYINRPPMNTPATGTGLGEVSHEQDGQRKKNDKFCNHVSLVWLALVDGPESCDKGKKQC